MATLLGALMSPALGRDPPLDPWTDAEWQVGLLGLAPGAIRGVRHTELLFNPRSASAALSEMQLELSFDDAGRPRTVQLHHRRRGEAEERHVWRYVHDAAGRVLRIDEEGHGTPALQRHYDAHGRLLQQEQRTGALIRRTRWRYDAAGREVERIEDGGVGGSTVHRRRYRRDGTLERLTVSRSMLESSETHFDAQGRPLRIVARDLTDRTATTIVYPHPLRAEQVIEVAALTKDGARRYRRELAFEVRRPEELQLTSGEPLQPVLRRERMQDREENEVRNEFDAAGRVVRQLERRGPIVRCENRIEYHASGLPASIRAVRLDAPGACPGAAQAVDYDIEVDARGQWVRHAITWVDEAGRRLRMAEHRREIDYR